MDIHLRKFSKIIKYGGLVMTINEYFEECKKLTYKEFKFYSEDTLEWIDEALKSADKQTRKDLNNTS